MVKVDGNLLERLFLFIIRFKIFQVPFALFFNNKSKNKSNIRAMVTAFAD